MAGRGGIVVFILEIIVKLRETEDLPLTVIVKKVGTQVGTV